MCWYYIPKFSCGHTGTPSSIKQECDSYHSTPRQPCTSEECKPEFNYIKFKCDACDAKNKKK